MLGTALVAFQEKPQPETPAADMGTNLTPDYTIFDLAHH